MSVQVGQIVRPFWSYLRRDGRLLDWAGYLSAQGFVASLVGMLNSTGDYYFDPTNSSDIPAPAYPADNYWNVQIWDIVGQTFRTVVYPESELGSGVIAALNRSIVDLQTYGTTQCFNLIRCRS